MGKSGRVLLDLAHYADSDEAEKDLERPWAWRYARGDRRSIAMPDEFTIEQIAAMNCRTDYRAEVAQGFSARRHQSRSRRRRREGATGGSHGHIRYCMARHDGALCAVPQRQIRPH
jgi:hypothetical protein